jgi:hypothetical protein
VDVQQFSVENGLDYEEIRDHWLIDYPAISKHLVNLPQPAYKFFRGVFPAWDNTARRQHSSAIFINSSPELYKQFLKATIAVTQAQHSGDERLVFINAWNEWAEGAHLEPDQKYGMKWLEATKEAINEHCELSEALALLNKNADPASIKVNESRPAIKKSEHQQEMPVTSEVDVILNSYTFKVGRIIMWIPIMVYNFFNRVKGSKDE